MSPVRMLALLLGGLAACSDGSATGTDAAVAATDLRMVTTDGALVGARPYMFHVPTGYDASKPTPLVILLHGYTASGAIQESYFKLAPVSDAHTFLYAYPDGTLDVGGKRFWNATDACCGFGNDVDDVGYLDAIIDDVALQYNLDAQRVYVVGHSNGGFMAHRYACDRARRVAAIVSLAGEVWADASKCQPEEPVSVLQVQGDHDETISYDGGTAGGFAGLPPFPSAHGTVALWALRDGCTGSLSATGNTLDLATNLAGAETRVEAYGGCAAPVGVELWTIAGGMHIPMFNASWGETVWSFLAAHPKKP